MAQKLSVLHIDDDPFDRMVVASALRRSGMNPVSLLQSPDVRGAEECLSHHVIDAILLDARRPDCESLSADIERLHQCSRAPVLILTALDRDQLETEAITAGGDGVLSKAEISSAALMSAIRDAVARCRYGRPRPKPSHVQVELATLRPLLADMAERVAKLRNAFTQLFIEADLGRVNSSIAEQCFDVFHHQQGDAELARALSSIAEAIDACIHEEEDSSLRAAMNHAWSTAWPWASDANVRIVYDACPDVRCRNVALSDLSTSLSALVAAQCFFSESDSEVRLSAETRDTGKVRVRIVAESGGMPKWLMEAPLKPTPGSDAALPALQALAALSKILLARHEIEPAWANMGAGVCLTLDVPVEAGVSD